MFFGVVLNMPRSIWRMSHDSFFFLFSLFSKGVPCSGGENRCCFPAAVVDMTCLSAVV